MYVLCKVNHYFIEGYFGGSTTKPIVNYEIEALLEEIEGGVVTVKLKYSIVG